MENQFTCGSRGGAGRGELTNFDLSAIIAEEDDLGLLLGRHDEILDCI